MEELREIRTFLEQGRYAEALALVGEMEEMGREDKINKIAGYLEIPLLHLIGKHAENRTTRTWEFSIREGGRPRPPCGWIGSSRPRAGRPRSRESPAPNVDGLR